MNSLTNPELVAPLAEPRFDPSKQFSKMPGAVES
jgi:hypothetical protein